MIARNTRKKTNIPSRDRIAAAALAEFAEQGLAGARVDRIASSAGVNKAMIYYHFSSKENLYEQVLDRLFNSVAARLREVIATDSDFESRLARLTETYVSILAENEQFPRLLLRELANPKGRIIRRIARILIRSGLAGGMQRLFRAGIADGTLRRMDVKQAVVSFLTMNIGYFLMAPVMDRALEIRDRRRFIRDRQKAVVDLFMNGVKAG